MQILRLTLCRLLLELNLINLEKNYHHLYIIDKLLYDVYLTLHTLTFQDKIEENIADV